MNTLRIVYLAGLALALAVSSCSSSDSSGTGTAGGNAGSATGGSAGSSPGGNAGSATGGSAGSSMGGTAGSATGGSAGGVTGGNAGSSTGGSAAGTGGTAGNAGALSDAGELDASDDTGLDATSESGGKVVVVKVGGLSFSFTPADVTIAVGDTVRWEWEGGFHTVTSGSSCVADDKFCSPNDTSCATAANSTTGATYEHTFTEAGSYPYFCIPHCLMGMVGSVTVNP